MKYLLAIALLGLTASKAAAQTTGLSCIDILNATIETRIPPGDLESCAEELVPEVVQRLNNAPGEANVEHLANFAEYASRIRDPAILAAAWNLMENQAAPAPARNLGFVFALGQHHVGLGPSG